MFARLMLVFTTGALVLDTVYAVATCRCYKAEDDSTLSIDIRVSESDTANQIMGIDMITAFTSDCVSSRVTDGDVAVHALTITVDATGLPGTITQTVPAVTINCYTSLDAVTGVITYPFVVAQQADVIQAADTYHTCTCSLEAALQEGMLSSGNGVAVDATSVSVTDGTTMTYSMEFGIFRNSDNSQYEIDANVPIGEEFYFKLTYNFPAGLDPGTFPNAARVKRLAVSKSASMTDTYEILAGEGCLVHAAEEAYGLTSLFEHLSTTTTDYVAKSGTTEFAVLRGSNKVFFYVEYSADCHFGEQRCTDQTTYCANLPQQQRRRRSTDAIAGNKTVGVNLVFGSGAGSALGGTANTSGSSTVCDAPSLFWITSLVLAALLLLTVLSFAFLFFRLKREQKKSEKIGQTYGVANPAF